MDPNIAQPAQPTTPLAQTPVSQATEPIQPVPNISSGKTKYLLLAILILLVLVVLGGGAYYLGIVKQQPLVQKNNTPPAAVIPSPTTTYIPTPTTASTPASTAQSTATPDPTANWKTYVNAQYGIQIKYPSTWFPEDVTNIAPGTGKLAIIDFFANGTTPTISTEGHQGNELLEMNISSNINGQQVVTQTKEQFIQSWTKLNYKNITVAGLPAEVNQFQYLIWYNDKIQLSIFSNNKEGQSYLAAIISSMQISPIQ